MSTYGYRLIENDNIEELNLEVKEALHCGWDLYGSPGGVYSQRLGIIYFQAVIMTEEIKK